MVKKKNPEPKPEPRFVVVYDDYPVGKFTYIVSSNGIYPEKIRMSAVFTTAQETVKFAESYPGARIFGLNPEYDYEVTRSLVARP